MESRCIRVKLKEGSIHQVREWFFELNIRKAEVLQSLRNEGIIVEAAFLDEVDELNIYLVYYIKSNNIDKAMEIFKNSTLPIDKYYKENWLKYCNESVLLEVLLDIDTLTEHPATLPKETDQ